MSGEVTTHYPLFFITLNVPPSSTSLSLTTSLDPIGTDTTGTTSVMADNGDYMFQSTMNRVGFMHQVAIPPPQPFFNSLKGSLKETFFPDDPFRQFKNQPSARKFVLTLQYFLPILEWAPRYTFQFFKADLIAGITIASLAIPQGISYAKLANLPPILGLYSSFVPPLLYAMMGSSRDLAVGNVAIGSLLTASMLGEEVSATEQPKLYLHLAFTATFFAGVFQAALGFLRWV